METTEKKGYFGEFGGSFIPSDLQNVMDILEENFYKYKDDEDFNRELNYYFEEYVGRKSPLYFAENLTKQCGGAKIYLKREDLNHTGAHKINHAIGEALLAKYLNKTKIIAETGAGQHGLAIATVCAQMGLDCEIHMGKIDTQKQKVNVEKMKLLIL